MREALGVLRAESGVVEELVDRPRVIEKQVFGEILHCALDDAWLLDLAAEGVVIDLHELLGAQRAVRRSARPRLTRSVARSRTATATTSSATANT